MCALILTHPNAYLVSLSDIPIKYHQPNNNLHSDNLLFALVACLVTVQVFACILQHNGQPNN